MPAAKQPNCYIIAGSNGAGKTTFATQFLPHYAVCEHFVNPDLIARGLSPFNPDIALVHAGRLVWERIDELRNARATFALETTLSGRAYARALRDLRANGYRIEMFYLWIPAPELALLRIRERVRNGGHNVPPADVRRRFTRSLDNLFHLYRPLLDKLRVFDNSTRTPRLIFEEGNGETMVYDANLYQQMLNVVTR